MLIFADSRQLLALGAQVEVLDERVEVLAQDLAGLDERHLGGDGAVGPDVEDQLVVVGALTDAGVLGLEAHALHRGVERVERDAPDLLLFLVGVLLGSGDIAAALGDGELHLEVHLVGEGGDDMALVEDRDRGVGLDEIRGDLARAGGGQTHGLGLVALERDDEVFHIQDDVRDIFHHTPERGELVLGALDLDGGDGCALDAREEDAAEGVADRRAEAALEGLNDKAPEVRVVQLRVAGDTGR